MPHNPASIVRLLYGERTAQQKRTEMLSLLGNSLTPSPPIGQGRPSSRPQQTVVSDIRHG